MQVYDYAGAKAVKWPEAEFIVGNPPSIGASRLRDSLGDGYAEALWKTHPKLTLTQMYNVLEKLRAGEAIEGKDKDIYDQGLIGILRDLQGQIDAAGAQAAKGKTGDMDLGVVAKVEKAPWPKTLPDQIAAVREALQEMREASPAQIARRFQRARTTNEEPLLQSLAALGHAELSDDGRYAA